MFNSLGFPLDESSCLSQNLMYNWGLNIIMSLFCSRLLLWVRVWGVCARVWGREFSLQKCRQICTGTIFLYMYDRPYYIDKILPKGGGGMGRASFPIPPSPHTHTHPSGLAGPCDLSKGLTFPSNR